MTFLTRLWLSPLLFLHLFFLPNGFLPSRLLSHSASPLTSPSPRVSGLHRPPPTACPSPALGRKVVRLHSRGAGARVTDSCLQRPRSGSSTQKWSVRDYGAWGSTKSPPPTPPPCESGAFQHHRALLLAPFCPLFSTHAPTFNYILIRRAEWSVGSPCR